MKPRSMVSLLKSQLIRVDKKIFSQYYSFFENVLEQECVNNCNTLLDVGCGQHSPIRKFSKRLEYSVGIDAFKPAIEESKKLKIHNEYKVMNWNKMEVVFKEKSFDCVCALDFIEHLSKEDGLNLITSMEKIARKKVIIFTPNGFLPQGVYYGNPFQVHLSGWGADEMKEMGYRVIGIDGYKPLRGEIAMIKWRPRLFWSKISLLSQPIVANRPSTAFRILCVKDLQ